LTPHQGNTLLSTIPPQSLSSYWYPSISYVTDRVSAYYDLNHAFIETYFLALPLYFLGLSNVRIFEDKLWIRLDEPMEIYGSTNPRFDRVKIDITGGIDSRLTSNSTREVPEPVVIGAQIRKRKRGKAETTGTADTFDEGEISFPSSNQFGLKNI
jgi:hypothetical protein